MADFISDDEMQKLEGSSSDFISDEQMEAMQPSQLESGLRGIAQGLTYNLADEVVGGAQAFGDLFQPSNEFSDFPELYAKRRDESRAAYDAAQEVNPKTFMAGNIGGSLATSFIPGLGVLNAAKGATTAGRVGIAAVQGGLSALGSSRAENALEMARDTAIGGATGAAFQGLGEKVIGPAVGKVGQLLNASKDSLMKKAVGATGAQAAKFSDDAAGEMSNYIKFGDTPEKIASRISTAKKAAGENISNQLSKLDEAGVTGSVDDIVASLESKIQELRKVSGNEGTIGQIEKAIKNLYERGESNVPLSFAEQAKRNFQSQVNYFSPEFEKKGATSVADAFRQEVEKKAIQANPEMAKSFMESKRLYGLLSPIEEAAQKRAAQQSSSALGGFSDMTSAALGGVLGGGVGAAGGIAAKNVLMPRVGSMAFVTADKLGGILSKNPQAFGKWSGALSSAAARGQDAFNVTHHLLQQTDEGYRQMMRKMGEEGQ